MCEFRSGPNSRFKGQKQLSSNNTGSQRSSEWTEYLFPNQLGNASTKASCSGQELNLRFKAEPRERPYTDDGKQLFFISTAVICRGNKTTLRQDDLGQILGTFS